MRRFVAAGLLLVLNGVFSFAATVGTIAGTVIDDKTSIALPGVNIVVEELGIGGSTDSDGDYFIEKDRKSVR